MTQFSDQSRSRDTYRYINGISRVLQNLLKYFNRTTIFTFAIPPLLALSVILDLSLNYLESDVSSLDSAIQYCHKLHDVFA